MSTIFKNGEGYTVRHNNTSIDTVRIYEAVYLGYAMDDSALVINKTKERINYPVKVVCADKEASLRIKEYFADVFETAAELGYPLEVCEKLLNLLDVVWNTQTEFETAVTGIMRNARYSYL